ncbi:MAG: hypothetical protein EOO89_00290 [Pedobacter sp.]|nr:MAG: hypothetical protein EOO89_00290 [Pedobacter sp.]
MEDIAGNDTVPQSERIIRQLLHYLLRNVPDEYGKFELSDHAIRLIELMRYKLDNPYKNYPLKETFEKYFVIRGTEIKTITDLEIKFGREFTAGHKRIISDHLTILEDELMESYKELNDILNTDEESATVLVRKFADVFRRFGERAGDITHAISSKDSFLRKLRNRVEEFYLMAEQLRHAQTDEDITTLKKYQNEWLIASSIQNDLETFFKSIDRKIDRIRKQILRASVKLRELQENFTRSSNFRSIISKLYQLYIEQQKAKIEHTNINFRLPVKGYVYERTQLFHPIHYNFGITRNSKIQDLEPNAAYEIQQRKEIEKEIRRQEIINSWVEIGKQYLLDDKHLKLSDFLATILQADDDLFIAQNVSMDLLNYAVESGLHQPSIKIELTNFIEEHVWTWNMEIKLRTIIHS